jgi:sugar transferase (PEP-CTERM/EpsH1 system associated)
LWRLKTKEAQVEILFLCHRIPYPPDKGDKIRSHALLTHLAKRHRVHLACFVDDPSDMAHAEAVRRLAGGECIFIPLGRAAKLVSMVKAILLGQPITTAWFGSHAITKWIDALLHTRKIDRAVVFSSAMAPYVLDNAMIDPRRVVLDLVDIDSDKWRQYAACLHGAKRWIYRREATKLFKLERSAALRFGATLLVSAYEAESFAGMVPEAAARIYALCNGVNSEYFAPKIFRNPFPAEEVPIVMTGRMDYRPNVDGAEWFFHEALPLLAKELPNARFYVVGANPPASLRALSGLKLVVTGQVDDVRPYLQHAAAVVAPLRIARGVQNKVLEAMAMAKPVVATQAATRALAVVSGIHLWIEDSPFGFARAVVAAAEGPDRFHVARSARNYVERHHDWEQNLAALDNLLAEGCDEPTAADEDLRSPSHANEINFTPEKSTAKPSSVGALQ